MRGAAATLLLNLSVLLTSELGFPSPPPPETVGALIQPGLTSLLGGEGGKEEDNAIKAVVALGTLLSKPTTQAAAKAAALPLVSDLQGLGERMGGVVKECVEDMGKFV